MSISIVRMRITSAIINLVPIYVLTFRENIPNTVDVFYWFVSVYSLCTSVGILLIFFDSANMAYQKPNLLCYS